MKQKIKNSSQTHKTLLSFHNMVYSHTLTAAPQQAGSWMNIHMNIHIKYTFSRAGGDEHAGFWSSSQPRQKASTQGSSWEPWPCAVELQRTGPTGAGFWHIVYSNQPLHLTVLSVTTSSDIKKRKEHYSECTRCMALEIIIPDFENSIMQIMHIRAFSV